MLEYKNEEIQRINQKEAILNPLIRLKMALQIMPCSTYNANT